MQTAPILAARVKWFNPIKGFGFLETQPECLETLGKDVFFHDQRRHAVGAGKPYAEFTVRISRPAPNPGDIVLFELGDLGRGPAAIKWGTAGLLVDLKKPPRNLPDLKNIPPLRLYKPKTAVAA